MARKGKKESLDNSNKLSIERKSLDKQRKRVLIITHLKNPNTVKHQRLIGLKSRQEMGRAAKGSNSTKLRFSTDRRSKRLKKNSRMRVLL